MNSPSVPHTLVPALRFYLRSTWRNTGRALGRGTSRTWGARCGPVEVGGHQLVLRSPQLKDGTQWREIRLRERDTIERWWASSPLSWAERHTEAQWVYYLLQSRRDARAGHALPLVVEIDGQLAGECNLESIAIVARTAEMGIWMDPKWVRKGLSTVAVGLMIDYAMTELGIHRITAPICEGNIAAMWGARRVGFLREGRMVGFLDVGGKRRDHDLWAITADHIPPGGLARAMIRVVARSRRGRTAASTPAPESPATPSMSVAANPAVVGQSCPCE